MADDSDIDLVLITGAGASREFGVRSPMPLMGDWANFLLDKLRTGGVHYEELSGLRQGLTGEEFETALGDFLHRVIAFEQVDPLIDASMSSPFVQGIPVNQLKGWYNQVNSDLRQIVDLVRQSVFEQFNRERVNSTKAGQAYGRLFERLQISAASRLVYATTNYDPIGECALDELNRIPDCGEVTSASRAGTSATIRTEGLLYGLGRYTPVLHLHGKVGWYRRADSGQVYSTPTTVHQSGYGVPILMLPDPYKSYSEDNVIMDLWSGLEAAVRRARRVLVLGHSLADSYLVRVLKTTIDPPYRRLGITVFSDDSGRPDASAIPVMQRIQEHFPNAAIIPMRFGCEPDYGDEGFANWKPTA